MRLNAIVDITQKEQYEKNLRNIVKILVEDWRETPEDAIIIREVSGGITNNLFKASVENSSTANVLIRIYGNKTELIIDRQKELDNIHHLYKTGFGPKVYGTFANGYIYEYYEGRSLSGDELKSGRWNSQIGHVLAKWHRIDTSKEPGIWTTIRQWIELVPEKYDNPNKEAHFAKIGGKDTVKREFDLLKKVAEELNSPVVFSHNDLLGGNVIVNDNTEEVKFIDFEYADANYQAFDIANHFNEWAGFEADYSRYPNKEEQYQFYHSYLKEFHGREPTPEELHTLYVQVNKFALLSHYYWGTWALVQGEISQLEFDFVEYSGLRFAEYFARKEEFLALK